MAHFFLKAFNLLRSQGTFGLIATNTIRQGDTRETGLTTLLSAGASITNAIRRLKWPGEAAVVVSVIHITKGNAMSSRLDGHDVNRISAYLVPGNFDVSPSRLSANTGKAFIGSVILGMGFTFDDKAAQKGVGTSISDMHQMIAANNKNADRIFPYIGGEEVNTSPSQRPHRYAIDFGELSEVKIREEWPDLVTIVETRVKKERSKLKDNIDGRKYKEYWWQYGRRAVKLYNKAQCMENIFALSRVSPHLSVVRIATGMIYAESLVLFAYDKYSAFAVLQSKIHEVWARFFSSSMKDDLRYGRSDCFETFPFPATLDVSPALETIGQAYHDHRAALMVGRNEGLTKTYNRFHARGENGPDVTRLRALHAEMDAAVLRTYGWDDLADRVAPIFLDENNEDDHTYQGRLFWPSAFRDEVLARLLALNAERAAAERAAGLTAVLEDEEDEIDDAAAAVA